MPAFAGMTYFKGVLFSRLIATFCCLMPLLAGCAKSIPFALLDPGVARVKSENKWSLDIGPEMSGSYRSLWVDDFNNSCGLDLIGGTTDPGDIFYWIGDGTGNWAREQRIRIRADVRSITAGDITGDGYRDLIFSSIGDTKGIHIRLNEQGHFKTAPPVTEKELYEGLRLIDINGDGHLDLIAANTSNISIGGIQVWLGNGQGNFITETGPTRIGIYKDAAVADLNQDGKLDIVGAGWGVDSASLRVWFGLGDGRWSAGPVLARDSYWGVEIADVDGDGNQDIIAASNFNGIQIYYGDGKGGFPRSTKLTEKGSFWRAKIADLDGNGLMDIIATSNDNHGIFIWYQEPTPEGGRHWVVKDEGLPLTGYYHDLAIRDINGDSQPDIIAASHGEGLKIWLKGAATTGIFSADCRKKEAITLPPPPVVKIEKMPEKVVIPVFTTAVFFDTGKVNLRPETIVVLNRVAEFLRTTEGTSLEMDGFADIRDIKTSEFPNNQILSEGRARSVARYLIEQGILPERIRQEAFGDSVVKYPGHDQASLQKNRRVDIRVIFRADPVVENSPAKSSSEINEAQPSVRLSGLAAVGPNSVAAPSQPIDPFEEAPELIPMLEYQAFKVTDGIAEYRIGPTDTVEATIWEGIKENIYKLNVSPRGTVSFSFITDFKLAGLTPTEADKALTEFLRQYIRHPLVKIRPTEKLAYSASIFGAVRDLTRQPTGPGTYRLYGQERLTEFISRVGGYLEKADLTRVEITRARKTYQVNVFDILFKADYRHDIAIDDGDVLFIPYKSEVKNRIFVFGEVMRPGLFSYDASINLLEALTLAGGPSYYAKADEVMVVRGDATKPDAFVVNLNDLYQKGDFRQNVSLQNGDIIYMATNMAGNIRDFLRTLSPYLTVMRTPMDIYGATAWPINEGFPIRRQAAPSATTIISAPPAMPTGGGETWGGK
ncbi:MAG: hypothetical protein A2520_03130 [Deltaproteobacteria bacterium RIFOXYD12_FULL_53_23]|nr:MAG: hypothetical protein A2520_03130 [Deltaproteobacteria bacterium RIFOXYD12_FULL_53_23]